MKVYKVVYKCELCKNQETVHYPVNGVGFFSMSDRYCTCSPGYGAMVCTRRFDGTQENDQDTAEA